MFRFVEQTHAPVDLQVVFVQALAEGERHRARKARFDGRMDAARQHGRNALTWDALARAIRGWNGPDVIFNTMYGAKLGEFDEAFAEAEVTRMTAYLRHSENTSTFKAEAVRAQKWAPRLEVA